ncbi:ABC transporter permease [Rhizobium oryzicola]|uniref:Proline/glycine betaine ABC transporter permease n=1 Tax=Rhizobium oryzicola TaxID=1232668 RepID=A0ABT8SZA5_9HYPH|nr:proline/glycine betaine ABC transporter permease [Rhizobium oryzicola]MDO1583223.1 proline/glycine betaine ABC transporter permease [Rhizobium oryzicola]
MEWWKSFPAMDDLRLTEIKKAIDSGFLQFTRTYGVVIEDFFAPLKSFLIWSEKLAITTPWPIVVLVFSAIAYASTRSWRIALGTTVGFCLIGYLGMWEDAMKTVSMIFASTLVSIALGLPVGILMSRYKWLRVSVTPVLDVMQTMPTFVYLIPVVMLLGIGKVPGLIAVVIYALPPVIRLTDLGIRLVDAEVLEAADAFGSSPWQKLVKVQLPLALPTIMAGINQTIMMALAMVVVASMIGVQGLGQPVLKAIANQYFTLGLFNGLAIVAIAIIFDRISQAFGRRLQNVRGHEQ